MFQPLVSIILTSYNQPALLEKAFNSLINQTYKNIEIVIVDDCSTDRESKSLILNFQKLYPEKVKPFFQKVNVGIPKNKNSGYRLASGEYITYLDGDDTYYKNKIASEVETFWTHPDVDVVYSNFDIKTMEGNLLSVWATKVKPAEGYIFEDMILNKFPDCHTQRYELFKRVVLYDLNFYDEQFSLYHDLDFMIRYSLKYKTAYNNNIGSTYYKNPQSIVSKTKGLLLIEQQEEVYHKYLQAIKDYNLEKPFKQYLRRLQLNKLFYLDDFNTKLLLTALIKQPAKVLEIAKIANYLLKKQKLKTNLKSIK